MIHPLIATHFWRNAPDGTGESDGNALELKVDRYAVLEGNVQALRENSDIREFYLGLNEIGSRKSYRDVKHYKRRKRWLS